MEAFGWVSFLLCFQREIDIQYILYLHILQDVEFFFDRTVLIKLLMMLLRALESRTLCQRQWKVELPCVQITGYVSVCVQVRLILFLNV